MLLGRNKFSILKRRLEKIEQNNVTIALYVLYAKKEKISCLCLSYSFNDFKPRKTRN